MAQNLAGTLHDRLGQSLAAIRLYLDLLRPNPTVPTRESLEQDIDHIDDLLNQAIAGLREMMANLRPPLLSERGLVVALEEEVRRLDARGVTTDVLLECEALMREIRWPTEVEYAIFMMVREAVEMAMRDAGATLIRVLLAGSPSGLKLEIINDGGRTMVEPDTEHDFSISVAQLRERAESISASVEFVSADDAGHRVAIHWEAGAD